ncbi:MAG: nucleoside triphosphate pyrophosphohydrolase [Clostridia bacterium]|nr:nucleoside triphosphate pyrophosphohydrolase [Clostridia bacterium]
MKTYNKLVRDRIPEIIEGEGKKCLYEVLGDFEYLVALDAKLEEEVAEYREDRSVNELADMLEVIYAAALALGYTREALEEIREEKARDRGVFEKKYFLRKVEE